jgi:hypothetical protein
VQNGAPTAGNGTPSAHDAKGRLVQSTAGCEKLAGRSVTRHLSTQRFSGAADFAEYVIEAFDCLHREGAHAPKMLSVGLHLRMIGRPGRIGALDRILRYIADKGEAWVARRVDIAHHWLARFLSDP